MGKEGFRALLLSFHIAQVRVLLGLQFGEEEFPLPLAAGETARDEETVRPKLRGMDAEGRAFQSVVGGLNVECSQGFVGPGRASRQAQGAGLRRIQRGHVGGLAGRARRVDFGGRLPRRIEGRERDLFLGEQHGAWRGRHGGGWWRRCRSGQSPLQRDLVIQLVRCRQSLALGAEEMPAPLAFNLRKHAAFQVWSLRREVRRDAPQGTIGIHAASTLRERSERFQSRRGIEPPRAFAGFDFGAEILLHRLFIDDATHPKFVLR